MSGIDEQHQHFHNFDNDTRFNLPSFFKSRQVKQRL
jgi:hypothetical protein